MSTTALLVASAAVSAVGSISQGMAANRAANFQAAVALQRAQRERDIANRNAEIFRRQQNALSGAERARRAASGVLPSEGTPLLVADAFLDEVLIGEATIRAGGETRATRLTQEATLARFRGRNARTAGLFRAGTTLLTGFAPFLSFGGGGGNVGLPGDAAFQGVLRAGTAT